MIIFASLSSLLTAKIRFYKLLLGYIELGLLQVIFLELHQLESVDNRPLRNFWLLNCYWFRLLFLYLGYPFL